MSKALLLWQVGLIANVNLHFFFIFLQHTYELTLMEKGRQMSEALRRMCLSSVLLLMKCDILWVISFLCDFVAW